MSLAQHELHQKTLAQPIQLLPLFVCRLSINNAQTQEVADLGLFSIVHLGGKYSTWSINELELNSVLPPLQADLMKCAFHFECPSFLWFPSAQIETAKVDLVSQRMREKKMCIFSPITSTGTWLCLFPILQLAEIENPFTHALAPEMWTNCFVSVIVDEKVLSTVQNKNANSQYHQILQKKLPDMVPFTCTTAEISITAAKLKKKNAEQGNNNINGQEQGSKSVLAFKATDQQLALVPPFAKPKPIILSYRTRYFPSTLARPSMEELMKQSISAFPGIENTYVIYSVKITEEDVRYISTNDVVKQINDYMVVFVEKGSQDK